MAKIKGCKISKLAARVVMEELRNTTRLRGDEIMEFRRNLIKKCSASFKGT